MTIASASSFPRSPSCDRRAVQTPTTLSARDQRAQTAPATFDRPPDARHVSRDGNRLGPAALARRSADHLHPRLGRQDERQPRVGAVDHERRRQPQSLSRQGLRRALVADRRSDRVYRDRASRRARRSSSAGWTRRARRRRSRASSSRHRHIAWSPDGTQLSFTMLVEDRNTWPIKMPKAPAGAKWTEAPRIVERLQLPARSHRVHRQRLPPHLRRPGDRRHAAAAHLGQLTITPAASGRRTASSILFSGLRAETDEYQWRESEIYAVDVATGDIRQLTTRKGPDGNPTISPDGKRIAYTGNDWARDTWIDSKLYVMNIDGSNPRLVSGDWDRSPSELSWAADGSGALLHRAERRDSQNLY